jgi:hypothetical protein
MTVSVGIAVFRLATVGVPRKVSTPVPSPVTEERGSPVQLDSVPLAGVPRTGALNVGLVSVLLVSVCVPEVVTTLLSAFTEVCAESVAMI